MQRLFPLISTMQPPAKPAPGALLQQVKTEAQAVKVAMKVGGCKLAFIALSLGVSESYASRIRNGKRRVPRWFITPFCRITGTLLLKQYRDLQQALAEIADGAKQDDIDERLAEQLRRAA